MLFAQCALAVSTMRNKAYLSVGNVCMGIGASIVDQEFFRCYLGMRTETVDMSEVQRRLQLNLFDPNEYQRAMAWTKANCTEMEDPNPLKSSKAGSKGRGVVYDRQNDADSAGPDGGKS